MPPLNRWTPGNPFASPAPPRWTRQRTALQDTDGKIYRIVETREGGWGLVTILEAAAGGRLAMKTYKSPTGNARLAERFVEEARRWILLSPHPHIVRAHYVVKVEGRDHVLMEYVEGSVRSRLDGGGLGLQEYLGLALQICLGMQHAQESLGLAHRDLKPENVLLTGRGTAKIADFGISILAAEDSAAGAAPPGTYAYRAPEDLAGRFDSRSDIYSFGVLSCEMLTGSLPASSGPARRTASQGRRHARQDLPALLPGAPQALIEILSRCLEEEPEARFSSFAELVRALAPLCRQHEASLPKEEVFFTLSDDAASSFSINTLPRDFHDPAMPAIPEMGVLYLAEQAVEHRNRAVSWIRLGRYEEALRHLEASLHVEIDLASAWCRRALRSHQKGNVKEATFYAQRILKTEERLAAVWHNQSIALGLKGEHAQALSAIERVLTIAPEDEDARTVSARLSKRASLAEVPLKTDEHYAFSTDLGKASILSFFAGETGRKLVGKRGLPSCYWQIRYLFARRTAGEILGKSRPGPVMWLRRIGKKPAADPVADYFRAARPLYPAASAEAHALFERARPGQQAFELTQDPLDLAPAMRDLFLALELWEAILGLVDECDFRAEEIDHLLRSEYERLPSEEEVRALWRDALIMWLATVTLLAKVYAEGLGDITPDAGRERALTLCRAVLALIESFHLEEIAVWRCRILTYMAIASNGMGQRAQARDHLRAARDCFRSLGRMEEARSAQEALLAMDRSS
ncbi:MAG TPA: serine/threonine-protein kinase [Thermoanaerobaculia bacterium]